MKNKRVTVKELLEKLEKIKNKNKYLVIEIAPLGDPVEFRISETVCDISIDEENNYVNLSNFRSQDSDPTPDISKIIDELKAYKDYLIKVRVNDSLYNIIYDEYMIDCYIRVDNLTDCIRLFTIKAGNFKF